MYPLSTAEQRAALLQATGGWPQLVEAAVRAARNGVADSRARQEAAGSLADSLALKESCCPWALYRPGRDESSGWQRIRLTRWGR